MEFHGVELDNEKMKKHFVIPKKLNDSNNRILKKILFYETHLTDSNFTKPNFFSSFFVSNNSISNTLDGIMKNIDNGDRFQILHSYAKNGKTTFIKYLEYKSSETESYNSDLKFHVFDFLNTTNSAKNTSPDSFIAKCHYFYEKYFFLGNESYKEKAEYVLKLINFLEKSKITIDDQHEEDIQFQYNKLFQGFKDDFKILIENTVLFGNSDSETERKKMFMDGLADMLNRQDPSKASELFCFLLLVIIIEHSDHFKKNFNTEITTSKKRFKILFCLDNIDDILSDAAEEIATNQAFYICKFFELLRCVESKINELVPGLDINHDICFVFSYRTANYLNAVYANSNHIYNNSTLDRYSDYFHYAPAFKISTVKNSGEIFLRRLNFYEKLCREFNIIKSSYFDLLNVIVDAFQDKDNEKDNIDPDLKYIFRLWNGNRIAILQILFHKNSINRLKFFPKIATNDSFLKKGAYIFLFLNMYKERFEGDAIEHVVNYIFNSFKKNIKEKKCSLKRIFLNYVIDKCGVDGRRMVFASSDISQKGVSLFEILFELSEIRKRDGKLVYSLNQIKKMLDNFFHNEIDTWGHLLTCYKGTTYTYGKKNFQGKKFDFSADIDSFQEFLNNDNQKIKTELSKIRFYYNDNAWYITKHIFKHFEYFSLFLGGKKPLSICTRIYSPRPGDPKLFKIDFEFKSVIDRVFNIVQECVTTTMESYIEYFSWNYTPHEYCTSGFAAGNKFFFDDLITMHITYIEKFRRQVLDNNIELDYSIKKSPHFTYDDIKKKANRYLTKMIAKYLELFFVNYRKIENNEESSFTLEGTNKSFKNLLAKVKTIENSDYRDLSTHISRNYQDGISLKKNK